VTALAAHYTPEHQMFRDTCRRFFDKEVVPFHMAWEEDGIVPRALWRKAGEYGLLGVTMPEEYGGSGGDFLYSAILIEEQGRAIASGRVLFPAAIRMASTPDSGNASSTTDCWSTKRSETWSSWAL